MPIFEYACGRCGRESALFFSGSRTPRPRCHSCGSRRLKRLISAIRLVGGSATDDGVLRSRPRDFLERPERFGQAMQAFSAKTGMKLTSEQLDGAMHRLSEAKKRI
jgi:putative FmdB family regulatory protein